MKSKTWLIRHNRDKYVKLAKKQGYVSRSAFKLIEIDDKFNIIKRSLRILELGSSPGGWSQVLCERNQKAKIYAFDKKEMLYKNDKIAFFKKNFLNFDYASLNIKYDLILSDIAPNTIGHKSTDHLRLISMLDEMILIVEKIIQINGIFVFKIWKGIEDKTILGKIKKRYKKINIFKPESSRKESVEIYIVAQKFIK